MRRKSLAEFAYVKKRLQEASRKKPLISFIPEHRGDETISFYTLQYTNSSFPSSQERRETTVNPLGGVYVSSPLFLTSLNALQPADPRKWIQTES